MTKVNLSEYKDFKEGQILYERIGKTSRYKTVLCKGIYVDEKGSFHAGFQYVDRKMTRQNKRVTVSGKSPLWFEKI